MRILIFIILLSCCFKLSYAQSDKVIGVWMSEEKDGKVEITKRNNKYYGKIIWIAQKNYINGEPKKDLNNPDPALRKRSNLGLEILKDFIYDSDDKEWTDGTVYDPKNGSTYSCYMWFEGNNENVLNIRGYIGFSLLGRTTLWTKTTKSE
ncbi:MAG: hypothetical protein A2033_12185 [Bacteroidetes bacterium GWA2_31_9]|nr:MAG: hypothetical protein A2033_12185 [Bacteroidetes bacterium GWA2_31_9]